MAAARARGADLGALVNRKEQRAGFLRRKAEQKEAGAVTAAASSAPYAQGLVEAAAVAQAEVRTLLPHPVSSVAPYSSGGVYRETYHVSITVLPGLGTVTIARGHVCLLLLEWATIVHYSFSATCLLSCNRTLAARAGRYCHREC